MSQTTSMALTNAWDICLNPETGNLAMVQGAARLAQDVACYERTFLGEPYFAADEGVPYLNGELAELPPLELVQARANARALEVPGVAEAQTVLTEFAARTLKGTIYVTDENGESANVTI